MDITTWWDNTHTSDVARAWFFNNRSDDIVKVLMFNMPILSNDNPTVQCALDISVKQVLESFQASLNDDGYQSVDDIIVSGNYTNYVASVTEIAIANTFYAMEGMVYDDGGFIEYDYGLNVSATDMMEYITDNIYVYQNHINQFAFIIFTSVITAIIATIKSLKTCGINIDTYEFKQSMDNKAVVNVACYIDRTAGLIMNKE